MKQIDASRIALSYSGSEAASVGSVSEVASSPVGLQTCIQPGYWVENASNEFFGPIHRFLGPRPPVASGEVALRVFLCPARAATASFPIPLAFVALGEREQLTPEDAVTAPEDVGDSTRET